MRIDLGRAPRFIAWTACALLASYAATAWLRPAILTAGVGLWWGIVAAALLLGGFACPFLFLGKANSWAQSTVSWRTIALDVSGCLGGIAVTWSGALAVALYRGWLK